MAKGGVVARMAGAWERGGAGVWVMVATFPDERMYLATDWVHGSTYLNPLTGLVPFNDLGPTGLVSSRESPNWYAWIAPVNTLDLHGEDLIDDAKLKQIIEKNDTSTDAQRWAATLSLAGAI
jgi:hypothetical protein